MSEPQDSPAPRPGRRRPGRVRRWVVRPFIWGLLLVVALLAAALFFVQSRFAHERALALLVARLSEYLGREITIGEIDYSFLPPAVEVRDAVLAGPSPGDPPVARVPYARLEMEVLDLRGRSFNLKQIEVQRPDVYLQFNPDGTSNFPRFRRRQRRGPQRFDIQVGRILVQDGTLRLNERKLPLTLEARAVWGRAIGRGERDGEGGTRLDVLVTAQEVVTTLPRARPYPVTVSAKGSILPREGRVQLTNVRLAGPELQAQTSGFVDWRRESRRIELQSNVQGTAALANRLGYMQEPIEGAFDAFVRFDMVGRDWRYGGTLNAPRLAVLDRELLDVTGDFTGTRETLDVALSRGGYAGGTVTGDITVDTRGGGEGVPVELDLEYTGLSLQKLIADQFPGRELPVVSGLSGRAAGTLQYRFNSRESLAGSGRADVRVQGAGEGGLPIAGTIPLTLDAGVIASEGARLTAPGQDVTVSGFRYDLQRKTGRLGFLLASQDVGPLGPVLVGRTPPGEEPPFWLPTQGRGTAEGTAEFQGDRVDLRVGLDLQDAVAPAVTADTVKGSFALTQTAVENLRLELTRRGGAVLLTGRVPLGEDGAPATEPLVMTVDAAQWPAGSLGYFLPAGLVEGVEGEVSGRLDLGGLPERLNGRAEIDVHNLTVAGNRVGEAEAEIGFQEGQILFERALVETPAGVVLARGTFDQPTGAMDFTVDAPSLSLAAEPFRQALPGLAGRMTVSATVAGTLDSPAASLAVRSRDLALRGRSLGEQGTADLDATWGGDRVDVQGSLLGLVDFDGGGRLDRAGADVLLDLKTDRLGALARLAAPQPVPDVSGALAGTLQVTADFAGEAVAGELRLPELRLGYEGRTIANLEPVVVRLTPERVEIRSFYMGEPASGSEVFVSGSLGLGGERVPLDLRVQSTLAATWAELLLPEGFEVQGSLDVLANVGGTVDNPALSGQGELEGGKLIVPNFAQSFEDVNGLLYFNRDRIELGGLSARLGGGTLQVGGTVTLPGEEQDFGYSVRVAAQDVSVRFPEMLLNRGDADLTVSSTETGRQIVGQIDLERSLYVEDVRLEVLQLLQSALQRERLEVPETDPVLAETDLNLEIRGPGALRVRNNVANLRGDVDLSVRGTLARPVLFGEVEIEPGGTLVYNDNEYEVERGLLTFNNPNRIDPVIDLVARTEIQEFDITLNLGGTFERPDIHFASDSNLADLEIVSLIATGERPEEDSLRQEGEQVAAGQVAQEFLAGQAASALGKRVGTLFGFDRFRIDPVAEVGQPISGVGVTVGKRLSRDVFVTYTSDPTSNRQYIVRVEWQVQRNLTLLLTQTGDGSYAVDAQWERRF